jgi:hypothetical protein
MARGVPQPVAEAPSERAAFVLSQESKLLEPAHVEIRVEIQIAEIQAVDLQVVEM